MEWKHETVSDGFDCEVRYITHVPVMGRLVLRQNNKGHRKGAWRIGRFGEQGHILKPKTVKGAKAAAKRWMKAELLRALKAVG
jgi:hypothetical protein